MANPSNRVISKVAAIFEEIAGVDASRLAGATFPSDAAGLIAKALAPQCGRAVAETIAFHMTDWNQDAAFVVALLLHPERFTRGEISAGVNLFLLHAPAHIAAAARLAGHEASAGGEAVPLVALRANLKEADRGEGTAAESVLREIRSTIRRRKPHRKS